MTRDEANQMLHELAVETDRAAKRLVAAEVKPVVAAFRPRGRNYLAFRENKNSKFSTVLSTP